MRKLFQLCVFACVFFFATPVDAQTLFGETVHLELTPRNPAPNERVDVRLNAYSVDVSGASIRWFIDGVEQDSFDDEYEMTTMLGALGTKTRITAEIYRPGRSTLSVTEVIAAQSVDLIIEPQTSAPVFYKGKPLPAPDEEIRAIAVPHTGGSDVYTYTWKLGQEVLGGAAGRGKDVVTFTMPRRETLLTVSATDSRGVYVGGRTIRLSPNNPEVLFYEENLLRGMRQNAIGNTLTLPQESETTIHAGVYNLAQDLFETSNRLYWLLDEERVYTHNQDGQSLTLRNEGGSQRVEVGFFAQNTDSLTQFVDDSFMLFFQ